MDDLEVLIDPSGRLYDPSIISATDDKGKSLLSDKEKERLRDMIGEIMPIHENRADFYNRRSSVAGYLENTANVLDVAGDFADFAMGFGFIGQTLKAGATYFAKHTAVTVATKVATNSLKNNYGKK